MPGKSLIYRALHYHTHSVPYVAICIWHDNNRVALIVHGPLHVACHTNQPQYTTLQYTYIALYNHT